MASLRRLNLDTSWLVTLPASSEYATSTVNILLDPWLDPSEQVDFARSFSTQRRSVPALASSVDELESLLQQERDIGVNEEREHDRARSRQVDAIVISHPFTDHMHPATLHTASARAIPVLATKDAYQPVKAILPQAEIHLIATAHMHEPPAWSNAIERRGPLAKNVQVLQALPQERRSFLNGPAGMAWQKLHGGLLILWKPPLGTIDNQALHSIVYSPHGMTPNSIPRWLSLPSEPSKGERSSATLLTSFDRIELPAWLSGTVNLGLERAMDLLSDYPADYLVETHGDEHKEKAGLVAKLLRRYWLGSKEEMPKERTNARQEERRQREAQTLVDAAIGSGRKTQVAVLDVGATLAL